jgi:hypothetical protein
VTETRSIMVCAECQVHWYIGHEVAKCSHSEHEHRIFEVHVHRSRVTLPDGTSVMAVSFDPVDPYSRQQNPNFGLYLDSGWNPPWPHEHVEWPDFGVPTNSGALYDGLRMLLERVQAGDTVELGCAGGHGRTGTALACLVVLSGHSPIEAVRWVREHYCNQAIETLEQEAFVAVFSGPPRNSRAP